MKIRGLWLPLVLVVAFWLCVYIGYRQCVRVQNVGLKVYKLDFDSKDVKRVLKDNGIEWSSSTSDVIMKEI